MKQFPLFLKRQFYLSALLITCFAGFSGSLVFAQPCIDTFPYLEDFDSGAGGWSASIPGLSGWTLGTPNKPVINSAASAPNSWITGGLTGTYANNNSSFVESPCFDFSNLTNPAIALSVWWESEYSWDGATLVSSIDNGASWQSVGKAYDPVNWYNDTTISGGQFGGPCGKGAGWTGLISNNLGSGGWVQAQRPLTGLGGQPNVKFRICFASDFSNKYDGFAFDDIIIAELPDIDLGPDTVMCYNDTLLLDGCFPSGEKYFWNTNPADTFCTLTVLNGSIFVITAIDSFGFIARDTIQVSFSPTNVQLPPNQLVCPGDSFIVNAMNSWANFLWLPDSTTNQVKTLKVAGKYKVIATDNFGCQSIDSITLYVDNVPVINLGPDTTICIGDSYTLNAGNASPGSSYLWNFGGATTQTIIVTAPGMYAVQLTTQAQCITTDTMNLSVQFTPAIDLGPDRVECDSFTLNANNPGSTFLWSTNQTTQAINSSIPGTYWVNVTNSFGCSSSDTVNITGGQIPLVNLGPDTVICNNQTITLNGGPASNQYLWSTSANTPSISVNLPGEYSVIVTNADNCVAYDTVVVTLSPLVVDLGPDFNICQGDSNLLYAGNTGLIYNWSTGENTPQIYITLGGVYSVTVIDTLGCLATDNIVITSQPDFTPDFSINPDTGDLFQQIQFTDLSSGSPTSWLWNFGDNTTSTQQNPTHTYQSIDTFTVCLTVSDGVCTNTICDQIVIDIFEDIEDELGLDLNVFPNPNKGVFQVDFSTFSFNRVKLEIYDMAGKIIMGKDLGNVASHRESINISNLPGGLYLLKLNINDQAVYRKVMVH